MKPLITKICICLLFVSSLLITGCENNDVIQELTIQEKIEMLENNEWLIYNGDDANVMYKFADGKRFNSYKSEGVWHEGSTVSSADYMAEGDLLTMDFYFGNVYTYNIEFSCNNNIVKFYIDGELANNTLYKRNSNYKDCLE